jgi:uncharacterized damage-inducible protein DinB
MKEKLIDTLQTSEQYTLAVAEAMPENDYQDKPVDTIWNFNELMNHIAYGIEWWKDNYIKKMEMAWNPPTAKGNKKATIAFLKETYTALKNAIYEEQFSEEAVRGLYATLDHITHHRGQATIFLRLKGITPPEYTY